MSQSSRCWQCGRPLVGATFVEIKDHVGNSLRVHHVCESAAWRFWQPITAKVRELVPAWYDSDNQPSV